MTCHSRAKRKPLEIQPTKRNQVCIKFQHKKRKTKTLSRRILSELPFYLDVLLLLFSRQLFERSNISLRTHPWHWTLFFARLLSHVAGTALADWAPQLSDGNKLSFCILKQSKSQQHLETDIPWNILKRESGYENIIMNPLSSVLHRLHLLWHKARQMKMVSQVIETGNWWIPPQRSMFTCFHNTKWNNQVSGLGHCTG